MRLRSNVGHPAVVHYSDRYATDIARCWRDIFAGLREGIPLPRLVIRARHAYKACWKRELLRYRETRSD